MKAKRMIRLLDNADAAVLLLKQDKEQGSNLSFRDLPSPYRKQIFNWALNEDSEYLDLESHRFQRLRDKRHQMILGHSGDRYNLQRTLLLKLLPELQKGGEPYNATASVLGPLLGWDNCVVAKRVSAKELDMLGFWSHGNLKSPQHHSLAGNAAQNLYEGLHRLHQSAICREFPLDSMLSQTPSALWIGHRIDLPDNHGTGHICAWGKPDLLDTDTSAWLIALAADTLGAWLLTQSPSGEKNYEHSTEPRDLLTSLPGRKTFDLALQHTVEAYKQRQQDCLIALVDIHGFSEINNTYGREQGDLLLKRLADELLEMSRRKDQVFRFGGDEFMLLMPLTKGRPPVAKRLKAIESILQENHPEFKLSYSMATLSDVKGSSEDLMLKIDQELNNFKQSSKLS